MEKHLAVNRGCGRVSWILFIILVIRISSDGSVLVVKLLRQRATGQRQINVEQADACNC